MAAWQKVQSLLKEKGIRNEKEAGSKNKQSKDERHDEQVSQKRAGKQQTGCVYI